MSEAIERAVAAILGYTLTNGLSGGQTLVQIRDTTADKFDVNVQWVNDVLIGGVGQPPDDTWGPE